jgi:hypothetical protein
MGTGGVIVVAALYELSPQGRLRPCPVRGGLAARQELPRGVVP